MNKSTKLIKDFSTNIIGSLLLVGCLQLLIYPYLARSNDPITYGTILALMGSLNIIVATLGNTLNNIRMISNAEYKKQGVQGDFKIILFGALIAGIVILLAVNRFLFVMHYVTNIILIATLIIALCRSYFSVEYRLFLNFNMSMICNVVIALGYVIGILIVHVTKLWPLAFLIGELSGFIFIFFTTDIMKEAVGKTILWKRTLSQYNTLIVSGLIGSLIVYLDRLILFPTLGGDAVATFSVASFFGKSLGLLFTPIAGVLLSYYSQLHFQMTRRLFWQINLFVLILSVIFYVITYFAAPWFTGLLYPTLIDRASPYIMLANLGAILAVASSMTQPAILRFSPMWLQIVVQVVYGSIYLFGGVILLKYYSITGFCVASIIANVIRLLILYWVGDRDISLRYTTA